MSPDPRIIPVGAEPPPLDAGRTRRPGRPPPGEAKGKAGEARRRAGGRFQTINAFIDVTMAALPPAERAVWLILWRDTKPDGLARTSQASLARRAGVTDRAVRSALRRLEREGLVVVARQGGGEPGLFRLPGPAAPRGTVVQRKQASG
jgi:hypothetical protein